MLPELLISKLRILYLHSRRRYLINSIPLLSIVALLVVIGLEIMPNLFNSHTVYAETETFGDSFASLTLDTDTITVPVTPGNRGYVTKELIINTNNIESYALTITAPKVLNRENDNTSQATSWGYAYGQSGSPEGMTYTNFTGSAQELESGNISTNGNNVTKVLALSADFSNTVTAGHYKAEVQLALTVTPKTAITYTLDYDANGGDINTVPLSQSCKAFDNTPCNIIISNVIPTRRGYEFLGWGENAHTTAAQYQPNTQISISNNTSLYAIWKALPIFDGITTMQAMTPSICKNAAENDTLELTDTRDQNKYWVTKLGDGNCWMTQNLDYEGGGTKVTDLSKWNTSTSAALSSYYDPGTIGSGHSAIGNYYGYSAAQNACPTNWSLPTSGNVNENGSYAKLFSVYNISDDVNGVNLLKSAPLYFMNGGTVKYFNNAITDETNGYYWGVTQITPRWSDGDYKPGFWFTTDKVYPSATVFQYNGNFVRCVVLGN